MEKFLKYNIDVETKTDDDNYAKVVVEPLERGFGNTLGNALRRIILSNIPGASMFAIKIPGVTHEFQAIEGVYEDVTQIILNLKKLVISIDENIYSDEELENTHIEEWPTLKINFSGPGDITGHDIEVPAGFEVINKDIHIATITRKSKFQMELYARTGRGFKTFKENKEGITSLSIIPTDSDYSPIIKVSYNVEEYKLSRQSVGDRLTIEVATNGAKKASDTIALAAKILTEHLIPLVDINERIHEIEVMKEREAETKKASLSIPIEDLDLTVRAYNALKGAGINTTHELIEKSRSEIDRIRNLGRKSVNEIIHKIHERGLKLKDNS